MRRLDKNRLKAAIPWQAAVLMAAMGVGAILIFAYVRDWWGILLVIAAFLAICASAYIAEGRNGIT